MVDCQPTFLPLCLLLFSLGKLLIITSAYTHQINRNWAVCFNLARFSTVLPLLIKLCPTLFYVHVRFRHPHKIQFEAMLFLRWCSLFSKMMEWKCFAVIHFFFCAFVFDENNDKLGFIASHQHLYRPLITLYDFLTRCSRLNIEMHLMNNWTQFQIIQKFAERVYYEKI